MRSLLIRLPSTAKDLPFLFHILAYLVLKGIYSSPRNLMSLYMTIWSCSAWASVIKYVKHFCTTCARTRACVLILFNLVFKLSRLKWCMTLAKAVRVSSCVRSEQRDVYSAVISFPLKTHMTPQTVLTSVGAVTRSWNSKNVRVALSSNNRKRMYSCRALNAAVTGARLVLFL